MDLCWQLKYVCDIISHLLYPLFVVLLLVQVLETQEFGLLYVILIIDSIVYENCLYYSIPKDIPDKREIVFNLDINLLAKWCLCSLIWYLSFSQLFRWYYPVINIQNDKA